MVEGELSSNLPLATVDPQKPTVYATVATLTFIADRSLGQALRLKTHCQEAPCSRNESTMNQDNFNDSPSRSCVHFSAIDPESPLGTLIIPSRYV